MRGVKPKKLTQEEKLVLIGEIITFLNKNNMKTYHIKVYPNWEVCLIRHGNLPVSTQPVDQLLAFLKRSFKE